MSVQLQHTLHSAVYLCWRPKSFWGFVMFVGAFFVLDSSLACFFLYTCGIVCGRSFFRTSHNHTLHSLVICVRRLSVWGFCYDVGALFLERGILHTFFACFFVLDSSTWAKVCAALSLERVISTHFIRLLFMFAA